MEPVDYLKILKSHWKVVAGLVLLAVVATFLASPKQASSAYQAEHVLLLEQSSSDPAAATVELQRAALRVTTAPQVTQHAAELLGYEGSEVGEAATDLSQKVQATPDSGVGSLTVTATDADPDRAVQVANAFALALIEVTDREATEEAGEDGQQSVAELEQELARLETDLENNPGAPDADEKRARTFEIQREVADREESVTVSYETLTEATSASRQASFFSTREQRMLFAGVFAALVGFGVSIVLDRNDSRIRSKEQAERRFGLPVLSEVPLLSLRNRSKAAVVSYQQEPRIAEAYRSLRTALLLFRGGSKGDATSGSSGGSGRYANGNGHPHQSSGSAAGSYAYGQDGQVRQLVAVTSPEPGEGKSTTSANLAMAYAEAGHSVLVLCWDLWRPISPAVFGAVDGPGITDYLEDPDPSLARYVQDTSVPGVRIVTAGVSGGHPSGRLDMAGRLLDDARTLANVIVVDTAPILSASVTRELATLADAVVLVCRVGRTTADAADRCAEQLERIGAPALGVALVGVPTGAFADYYGPSRKAGYDRVVGPRRKPDASSSPEPVGSSPSGSSSGGSGGRHLRSSSSSSSASSPSSGNPYRASVSSSRSDRARRYPEGRYPEGRYPEGRGRGR